MVSKFPLLLFKIQYPDKKKLKENYLDISDFI